MERYETLTEPRAAVESRCGPVSDGTWRHIRPDDPEPFDGGHRDETIARARTTEDYQKERREQLDRLFDTVGIELPEAEFLLSMAGRARIGLRVIDPNPIDGKITDRELLAIARVETVVELARWRRTSRADTVEEVLRAVFRWETMSDDGRKVLTGLANDAAKVGAQLMAAQTGRRDQGRHRLAQIEVEIRRSLLREEFRRLVEARAARNDAPPKSLMELIGEAHSAITWQKIWEAAVSEYGLDYADPDSLRTTFKRARDAYPDPRVFESLDYFVQHIIELEAFARISGPKARTADS